MVELIIFEASLAMDFDCSLMIYSYFSTIFSIVISLSSFIRAFTDAHKLFSSLSNPTNSTILSILVISSPFLSLLESSSSLLASTSASLKDKI